MTETERLKERLKDISSMESFTIRQRVDAMLKIDAEMYMELGITSTLRERKDIQRCMGNAVMNQDYPTKDERYAVCQLAFKKNFDPKQ